MQSSRSLAAFKEYLKALQNTQYSGWYWKDRREVLDALKVVLEVIQQGGTAHAIETICVSCSVSQW